MQKMKQCSKIDEYYCSDYWNVTKATLKLEGNYNKTVAYPKTTDVTAQFGLDATSYTNHQHQIFSKHALNLYLSKNLLNIFIGPESDHWEYLSLTD